jgi:hypothetical protein
MTVAPCHWTPACIEGRALVELDRAQAEAMRITARSPAVAEKHGVLDRDPNPVAVLELWDAMVY